MMIDFALAAEREQACRRAKLFTRLVCCVFVRSYDHSGGSAWCAAADVEYRGRAELRRPLGIGMVGGLIVSQV